MAKLSHLRRMSDACCVLDNPFQIPAHLFAREDVPIEQNAIDQVRTILSLEERIQKILSMQKSGQIEPFFGSVDAHLRKVVLTPDLHVGVVTTPEMS